jgi:hypothetical protein
MFSIFVATGLVSGVIFFFSSWGGASSFLFSTGFSGVSNLMIFRSGSGFLPGCSAGLGCSFTSGIFSVLLGESSLEGIGSSFPNFNFICTPPYIPNL